MENIETLLQQFVDDREQLSDEQLDALCEAASADALLAARLKDQLIIDEYLAQQLAIDRRGFVAQVEQRIRDDQPGSPEPPAADPNIGMEMRDLLDVELAAQQRQAQRRGTQRWNWVVAGLILLLVAAGGGWWWMQFMQPVAVVEAVDGNPSLTREGRPAVIKAGTSLRPGDKIVTLPDESVSLRYRDGSELRLTGDTSAQLTPSTTNTGKHVTIAWGAILAEVVPQPAARPMQFKTPLSVATVRGTRLWLSADDERTRLDVMEGVVELKRSSDGETLPVRAREFAVATPDAFSVKPLTWPVDRRDAVVLLETVDRVSQVRTDDAGNWKPLELRPRGQARLDHDYALVLAGGSYGLHNASAPVLDSCQMTGELTIEVTITPTYAQHSQPTRIVTCSSKSDNYNFVLGQRDDRLFLRLRTDGADSSAGSEIELCRLVADQPQHLVVSYRDGDLVCYLDGRRVHHGGAVRGGFSNWERLAITLGDDQRGGRDWAGTLQGLAIYDRYIDDDEAQRNAELYRNLISSRPPVPQMEIHATLLEKSRIPAADEILPAKSALVVCRWQVDGVLTGQLVETEVMVVHWALLGGEPQPIATAEPGVQRQMLIERFGVNTQLEGVPRIDDFQDPEHRQARYYEASNP